MIVKTRFGQSVLMIIKRLQDPYYQGFAAQVAFFYMLSIVPTLILLTQLLKLFDISADFIQNMINTYSMGAFGTILSEWLTSSGGVAGNIILLVIALWAASRAQFSLTRITNYTMTDGKSTGKGYFEERFRAIGAILVTIISLTFGLVVLVFGQQIIYAILKGMRDSLHMTVVISNMWTWLGYLLSFLLYFGMVVFSSYITLSDRSENIRFRDILPGSIVTAIGMIVITFIFALYTNYVMTEGNYNVLYGSLASIAALLFWFYFIAWVQCLGTMFNKAWIDTGKRKVAIKEDHA